MQENVSFSFCKKDPADKLSSSSAGREEKPIHHISGPFRRVLGTQTIAACASELLFSMPHVP